MDKNMHVCSVLSVPAGVCWRALRLSADLAGRVQTKHAHSMRAHASCVPSPPLLQVIAKAKVPIVKFEDAETGYAFDISFDVANGPEVSSL